jgi:hypothetical protein
MRHNNTGYWNKTHVKSVGVELSSYLVLRALGTAGHNIWVPSATCDQTPSLDSRSTQTINRSSHVMCNITGSINFIRLFMKLLMDGTTWTWRCTQGLLRMNVPNKMSDVCRINNDSENLMYTSLKSRPRSLGRGFAAARLLELWVQIPPGGKDVCLLWMLCVVR